MSQQILKQLVSCALLCCASVLLLGGALAAQAKPSHHPQIMIVGISHLVARQDLHNFDLGDPMSHNMQTQIADAMQRLLKFAPTKVMIEAEYSNQSIRQQYQDYLRGHFTLGPNENYQYGFQLAALAGNKVIYPVDAQGFPFEFEKLQAFAKAHGQQTILDNANAETFDKFQAGMNKAMSTGQLLDVLRFLNSPEAFRENEGWYLVIDKIGSADEHPGADLVSNWWARNLHIFANVLRSLDSSDDRVVLFIGQGHAAILRNFVMNSPELELVDPEPFLR